MRKVLVVHGEGLGNIVEVLPLLATLDREFGSADLALSHSTFGIVKELFPGRNVYMPGETVPEAGYCGKIVTVWAKKDVAPGLKGLNHINNQRMKLDRSEVSVYLHAAVELGIPKEKFVFDCSSLIGSEATGESFDVVISNGFNWKNANVWQAKAWRRYEEFAGMLTGAGLRVCSVGHPNELVKGTEDRTGLGLMRTLGLIKESKTLVSNDSGLYHCACAMGKPTVAIFTFTSVRKNWDERFHRTARILGIEGLECRKTCQAHGVWLKCKHQKCRDLSADVVFDAVKRSVAGE